MQIQEWKRPLQKLRDEMVMVNLTLWLNPEPLISSGVVGIVDTDTGVEIATFQIAAAASSDRATQYSDSMYYCTGQCTDRTKHRDWNIWKWRQLLLPGTGRDLFCDIVLSRISPCWTVFLQIRIPSAHHLWKYVGRVKRTYAFVVCVDSEGPDQLAPMCSLFRDFTVRCKNHSISQNVSTESKSPDYPLHICRITWIRIFCASSKAYFRLTLPMASKRFT